MELMELRRLAFLAKNSAAGSRASKRPRFTPMSAPVHATMQNRNSRVLKPGLRRLVRFIELVDLLGSVPWASKRFRENDRMLRRFIHSHLPLIAGEYYTDEKNALEALANAPDPSGNVIWITSK